MLYVCVCVCMYVSLVLLAQQALCYMCPHVLCICPRTTIYRSSSAFGVSAEMTIFFPSCRNKRLMHSSYWYAVAAVACHAVAAVVYSRTRTHAVAAVAAFAQQVFNAQHLVRVAGWAQRMRYQ